ncbi:MAG: hypothetical protein A2429_00245 [Candidatus Veblenbacteria bacterium RIFOXYC1_FULL_42_9]|uniref:Helicase ATP-binding domain-containing protein n=1 Tax=Candidatus Veblenbacteria bacterium RIFOXYC1_FULL_42_9 TaxID=1802427 RepID=A0A1G2Q3A8_9BACT|nr:MAG: hypothetical protein A2429_00245 [Candidatus Veblenbacteria bacterium RIFOXYC1_FULL_42_9]HAO81727.1 hypothetical protein [Candidatus Veblenbacteria bacterium]
MTGNKSPVKGTQLWQNKSLKLVLATPHTIINDLRQRIFPQGHFAFLIVDEFHHAHKKYPYVPIALAAYKAGALILSLSATAEDLEALKNCFVTKIVKAEISMPQKISPTSEKKHPSG